MSLSVFFGWQPLEKGVLKFEIALELFSSILFWWQPLEKGVLKFEIALELFYSLVATLGNGSPEI